MSQLHARRVHLIPEPPFGPQLQLLQPSFHSSPTACVLPSLSLQPPPPPDSGVALVIDAGVSDDAVDGVEEVPLAGVDGPPQATRSKAARTKLFIMRAAYPRC